MSLGGIGRQSLVAAIALGALCPLAASSALAGTFQVSPINITVPHNRPVGAITVKNEADEAVSIRVVTYKWTQDGGKDVYSETSDMLASPPIFTLGPRGSQLIRVGLRKSASDDEAAYRVILEEIPRPAGDTAGIRVSLRLNLPFYKQPKLKSAANVQWSAVRRIDGALELKAANGGTLHDQISRIDIQDSKGVRSTLVDRGGVVLPGSTRIWNASGKADVAAGKPLKLIVVKPGGEETAEALVQAQP